MEPHVSNHNLMKRNTRDGYMQLERWSWFLWKPISAEPSALLASRIHTSSFESFYAPFRLCIYSLQQGHSSVFSFLESLAAFCLFAANKEWFFTQWKLTWLPLIPPRWRVIGSMSSQLVIHTLSTNSVLHEPDERSVARTGTKRRHQGLRRQLLSSTLSKGKPTPSLEGPYCLGKLTVVF